MKTFLLGVGCQKGGTSWLHNYLKHHSQCDFGFRKEYHVFDALWLKECNRFRKRALTRIADLASARSKRAPLFKGQADAQLDQALRYASFYANTKNYADYFDGLHRASDAVRLVGDITPAYAGLSAGQLGRIRRLLEGRGFHVKTIFLMRDPVERVYSQVRMRIRDGHAAPDVSDPVQVLNAEFAGPQRDWRTRYDRTLAALDKAFAPEDVLLGFYETLFFESELRRITDFLGIDCEPADFGHQVNASPRSAELESETAAPVRAHYDATYQACFDRFGEDFIKGIWRHA